MAININGATGISGVDGSAGTPAIQGSDTNTGVSFGTNTIDLSTDGTSRLFIDSSGRLLVGASSWTGTHKLLVQANASNSAGSGNIALARGESAADMSTGDVLGRIEFLDQDGGRYAFIDGRTDAASGSGDNPGRLTFQTTADSASTPTEAMRIDSSQNLLFNSGFGSVATAYGCRAWVNFQGTSTVTIRSSGNVSSITDEGTGDYRINFTNAMPDDNYGVAPCSYAQSGSSFVVALKFKSASGHPMTTNWVAVVSENTSGRLDIEFCCVAVFR